MAFSDKLLVASCKIGGLGSSKTILFFSAGIISCANTVRKKITYPAVHREKMRTKKRTRKSKSLPIPGKNICFFTGFFLLRLLVFFRATIISIVFVFMLRVEKLFVLFISLQDEIT
jgi:hypothetical protein